MVIIGQAINKKREINSNIKSRNNKIRSINIIQNLTNIPTPIENQIKPSRYSFFKGLKKVRSRRIKENCCKNALLSEEK